MVFAQSPSLATWKDRKNGPGLLEAKDQPPDSFTSVYLLRSVSSADADRHPTQPSRSWDPVCASRSTPETVWIGASVNGLVSVTSLVGVAARRESVAVAGPVGVADVAVSIPLDSGLLTIADAAMNSAVAVSARSRSGIFRRAEDFLVGLTTKAPPQAAA
jgi:hypothetical protein